MLLCNMCVDPCSILGIGHVTVCNTNMCFVLCLHGFIRMHAIII